MGQEMKVYKSPYRCPACKAKGTLQSPGEYGLLSLPGLGVTASGETFSPGRNFVVRFFNCATCGYVAFFKANQSEFGGGDFTITAED